MLKSRVKGLSTDMLTGNPLKSILSFALPIFFGSIFQQLYNMVDSIVVGNFVGANALAAVGTSGTICNCLVMACLGFTTGASVVIAQQFGANRKSEIKASISTTVIFLVTLSIILTAASLPLAPKLASLINVPDNIIDDAVLYIRIYCSGLIFIMMYNLFASVLRALGDSVTPLIFLVFSSLLNIVGDLFFVIKLNMGVSGVAWATVISQAVSVFLCILYVARKNEYFRFGKKEFIFDKRIFGFIMRMGVPSALQSCVTNIGFVCVQSLVNSFGSVNIAAYTAANKMENFSMLPISSMAQSFAVYVGQNMGAGDVKRTKRGLRESVLSVSVLCIICSAIIYIIGPQLIGLFVDSSETVVISRGTAYMRAFSPFLIFHGLMSIFVSALRGSGDSIMSMVCSFTDLGMRLCMAYVLSFVLDIGFMGCAYAIPIGWLCSAILAFVRYLTGKWQSKTVVRKESV